MIPDCGFMRQAFGPSRADFAEFTQVMATCPWYRSFASFVGIIGIFLHSRAPEALALLSMPSRYAAEAR
jgi:hypothetical protein